MKKCWFFVFDGVLVCEWLVGIGGMGGINIVGEVVVLLVILGI